MEGMRGEETYVHMAINCTVYDAQEVRKPLRTHPHYDTCL